MESTIAMIRRTLTDEGLVRRTAAGLGGTPEGAFLACSFWMADCLALQGKVDEAKAQFERVLAFATMLVCWQKNTTSLAAIWPAIFHRRCRTWP